MPDHRGDCTGGYRSRLSQVGRKDNGVLRFDAESPVFNDMNRAFFH